MSELCQDTDSKAYFVCTRKEGHEGRHKAKIPTGKVVSVWDN